MTDGAILLRPGNRLSRRLAILTVLLMVAGGCSQPSTTTSPSARQLNASVASYDLAVGNQRFLVGLRNRDQALIGGGSVKLKFAYTGTKVSPIDTPKFALTEAAKFLLVPHENSSSYSPPAEPSVIPAVKGSGVYGADVNFDRAGYWKVQVDAGPIGGRLPAETTFEVLPAHRFPWLGESAPRTDNLTAASANVPAGAIDSRAQDGLAIPDPELHATTVAQSLEQHRPVLLVVSTPVYCVSRFCGPITDLVASLATTYSSRANFIHIEVWEDFQNGKVNPAAAEWIEREGDVTEPWIFLIDGSGKIVERWDNVVTASELETALRALPSS